MQPEFFSPVIPSPVWVKLYVLVGVAMFLGCLYHAIKMGLAEYRMSRVRDNSRCTPFFAAITQVALLAGFTVFYWFLESAAQHFTPYFVYSLEFPDLVGLLWREPDSLKTLCPEFVRALVKGDKGYDAIPLSVLMMEASLTYAAMWTALALHDQKKTPRYLVVPLWAALFVVILDALLDPVVGVTYTCEGVVRDPGIGLWHWFLPGGEDGYRLAHWFGVPLFNYAAWSAGPVILISFAMLIDFARKRGWPGVVNSVQERAWPGLRRRDVVDSAPAGWDIGFILICFVIATLVYVLIFLVPNEFTKLLPVWTQTALLGLVVLLLLIVVGWRASSFHTDRDANPNTTLPPLLFMGFPALALLIEGIFLEIPEFILVGLVALVLVMMFALWPYGKAIYRVAKGVIDLDRFMRLAYFGFPASMVLLGATAVALTRSVEEGIDVQLVKWDIGGLLLVALAFHIFAYVFNDWVDLDIDKTQEKRKNDPLVRGAISPEAALAFALVQIPAAFIFTFLLHAGRDQGWVDAAPSGAVLVASFALMFVYNLFGKRCKVPPLTDAVQAVAWGLLAVFAALVVDPDLKSDNWILVWTIFAFGVGFILLINGIHGGLRDFENDERRGCQTTARCLGAELGHGGAVLSTWKIKAFAYTVHVAMFTIMPTILLLMARGVDVDVHRTGVELEISERWKLAAFLAFSFLLSHSKLRQIVRRDEPKRDQYTSCHALIMVHIPIFAVGAFIVGRDVLFILLGCFWGSLLFNRYSVKGLLSLTHRHIADKL